MEWTQSKFSERLEQALDRKGWTQKFFASEVLKVPEGTLSGWKDRNEPSFSDIARIAGKLDVRACWLLFGDEFEPMDDEERAMITNWRRLSEPERAGFFNTIQAITVAREQTKKPGNRTRAKAAVMDEFTLQAETAPPRPSSPAPALIEFLRKLPEVSAVQKIQADLLEHESVLAVGTKAQLSVESASTLLDQLIALLQSKPPLGSHTDSAASSPATAPKHAKQKQGHRKSGQP
ncbi:MAG TPA: helix-turn-helix transcriptional regulator [Planctomycetota bacterium]|nr:helix-turn-helix transcriptional regulator [Planctomycetota bacterium]